MTDIRRGRITSVSPPQVRLDGTASSVPLDDWTEDSALVVNAYVLVAVRPVPGTRRSELILLGTSGGGVPAGVVWEFDGPTANIPAGWLVCDGSAVSRTTYARLFAAIGTLHGAGNGTTTFNLPDRRGRVGVGREAGSSTWANIGDKPGQKDVTLTVDQIPSHDHGPSGAAYNFWGYNGTTGGEGTWNPGNASGVAGFDRTGSTGGGQPHTNVQPSFVTNFIIKT